MHRVYLIERLTGNKNTSKFPDQLKAIRRAAMQEKSSGVTAKVMFNSKKKPEVIADGSVNANYRYTAKLRIEKDSFQSEEQANEVLDKVEKIIKQACELNSWRMVGQAGGFAVPATTINMSARPPFVVPELNEATLRTYFNGIYNRDSHIRLIHDSVKAYERSNGDRRNHTVLYGKPAACKTMLYERLKMFYEAESTTERVHIVDATGLTKAGLENYLLTKAENKELFEILVIEEIEKKNLNDMILLGSILDGRGTLEKLNARVDRKAKVKMLVWATCNDPELLINFHRGFLWSRFANKLECIRPNRAEALEILLHKVEDMQGNPMWAEKAVEFGFDVLKTDDLREIDAMLDGGDRLLTGEYQRDRLNVMRKNNTIDNCNAVC